MQKSMAMSEIIKNINGIMEFSRREEDKKTKKLTGKEYVKIQKNLRRMTEVYKPYEEAKKSVDEKYIVEEDGQQRYKDADAMQAYQKEINEMLNEESIIDIDMIEDTALETSDMILADYNDLDFMIDYK